MKMFLVVLWTIKAPSQVLEMTWNDL